MLRYRLFLLLLAACCTLSAQTNVGLIAYYPFDGNTDDQTNNTANTGIEVGDPEYNCGINGSAIEFDGSEDGVLYPQGAINLEFDDEDFTVSFYFKPNGGGGTQYLLSKTDSSCVAEANFFIDYQPNSRVIRAFLSENPGKSVTLIHTINNPNCWQHVTLVRAGLKTTMYINNEFAVEIESNSRVNIQNDGKLLLGGSPCVQAGQGFFRGRMDEFRVYNQALSRLELATLYLGAPDRIINGDTLIYLGGSVETSISQSCATAFSWSPQIDVDDPNSGETTIRPQEAGTFTYALNFIDQAFGCQASDSIEILVIDPADLNCESVFLPTAFTPNNDNLNDFFAISNPFALTETFTSFEIFDRWGSRVFFAADPNAAWDGSFDGQPLNPGVFLYRLVFQCNGEEVVQQGSVTLLR